MGFERLRNYSANVSEQKGESCVAVSASVHIHNAQTKSAQDKSIAKLSPKLRCQHCSVKNQGVLC